jgi:hypothetical protein
LLLKEPIGTDIDIVKGAGNALVVSENGDARLLEIGGTAERVNDFDTAGFGI